MASTNPLSYFKLSLPVFLTFASSALGASILAYTGGW